MKERSNKFSVKLFIVSTAVVAVNTSSLVTSLNKPYTSESFVILLLLPLISDIAFFPSLPFKPLVAWTLTQPLFSSDVFPVYPLQIWM